MALLFRVFGWSPPNNAEYVDVLLPGQSSSTCHTPTYPTAAIEQASQVEQDQQDGSSNSPLSPATTGENKHVDTPWVARPRNKFILFRCDYVRKHSCDGKRARHGLGNEKSLSKQAAEAWHYLSKEDRMYWKECAIRERIEHAKKYPDYKYRPKKGTVVRKRQSRSSSNTLESKSSNKIIPQQNIRSPYDQQRTPTTIPLPPRLQIPTPSPSFNTPDSDAHSPNTFLVNSFPPTFSSASLSNWNRENTAYQTPASNLGLEMAAPVDNNTGTNQFVMHEYTTGDMHFTPPPSPLHYQQQQQQQQLFDNSLYQQTQNLWTSYPTDGNGTQMDITSQADFNTAYWHAHFQHATHGCAPASTLPMLPNETMSFDGGPSSTFGNEQLLALMGF